MITTTFPLSVGFINAAALIFVNAFAIYIFNFAYHNNFSNEVTRRHMTKRLSLSLETSCFEFLAGNNDEDVKSRVLLGFAKLYDGAR